MLIKYYDLINNDTYLYYENNQEFYRSPKKNEPIGINIIRQEKPKRITNNDIINENFCIIKDSKNKIKLILFSEKFLKNS